MLLLLVLLAFLAGSLIMQLTLVPAAVVVVYVCSFCLRLVY